LEEIEAQRNAEKARHDREILALRDSNEARESDRRHVETQVADLEDAHQALSAENASLAKTLAATESDLRATANAETALKAQVQTLASELQSQQDAHQRLKAKARESEDARRALQAQKQNTDSENERLVVRLSENALALATAQLDRQAMTEERVALNEAMRAISSELKNQRDTNQHLRDETDHIRQTLTALAVEQRETEAAYSETSARLLETASTLQAISKENEELQKMLLRSEETAADLRQQLDNAQASTASLETGNALTELRPVPVAGNPKPVYPRLAIRRGIEGEVSLSVSVSSSGQVSGVTVSKPSGFSILDRAAVDSVRQWQFTPATRDGMPTAMVIDIPVQFRLIDARG
jgi:TonB family protein